MTITGQHNAYKEMEQHISNLSLRWLNHEDANALQEVAKYLKDTITRPADSDTPEMVKLARRATVELFAKSYERGLRLLDPAALHIEEILLDHEGWRECEPGSDASYALADLLSKFIRGLGIDGQLYPQYLANVSTVVSSWTGAHVQFLKEEDIDIFHRTLFGDAWSTIYASEIESALDDPYADYLRLLRPPFLAMGNPGIISVDLPDSITP